MDEENARFLVDNDDSSTKAEPRAAERAVNLSFNTNVFLFFLKFVAFLLSGSLSVLASLLDSFLDLLSGMILYLSMRAMGTASKDSFRFPVGKNRLEPLGVMLFAVVMGISMLMLAREAVTNLIMGFTSDSGEGGVPTFGPEVLAGIVATVVIKAALHIYCKYVAEKTNSSAVETYAEDHRNDVLTNSLGLLGGYLAAKVDGMWWIDPLIALILSLFVAYNWLGSAHEQLWLLVGKSASPELLNKLTLMAHNHDERIEKVDTIRAYTVGSKFFAEVHIVMRPETLLHVAHDVGEALEKDIEGYFEEEIERAFVHIDYEWNHMPRDEHSTNPTLKQHRNSNLDDSKSLPKNQSDEKNNSSFWRLPSTLSSSSSEIRDSNSSKEEEEEQQNSLGMI